MKFDRRVVHRGPARHQLGQVATVVRKLRVGFAKERLFVKSDNQIKPVENRVAIHVADPDAVVAVLTHDIRVEFDIREDPKTTADHRAVERFRGNINSTALGAADQPGNIAGIQSTSPVLSITLQLSPSVAIKRIADYDRSTNNYLYKSR